MPVTDKKPDGATPPAVDNAAAFADAMAAFSRAEEAIIAAIAAAENLEHEEASGLRGLFATVLATMRAGKPGGVPSP